MVQQLAAIAKSEKWQVEPAALEAISRHAQGSLRDAESILDQVASYAEGKVRVGDVDELLGATDWEETSALFDAIAANDAAKAVGLVRTLVDDGRDLRLFVRRAMDHMRALVLVRASDTLPETATESIAAVLRAQAPLFSLDRLAKIAHRLIEAEVQLRTGEGTPLPLELALLDLTTESASPASAPKQPAPQNAPPKVAAPSRAAPTPPQPAPRSQSVVDLAERRAQQPARPAETAPDRPAGAASPGVTLERVRSAWDQLLERAQERSIAKAAQLVKAEPVAIEGGTIVLAFSDEFARQMWDRQRPELERDLGELVGIAMRVRCVKQPAAAATNTQPATEDPMLRAALETFRRPDRILEVE
jgi:DNA polymerase-3 subunit gamma/tau